MAIALVVEDETQVRLLAESILQGAGHEVLGAATYSEAEAVVGSDQHIDLSVVDIVLMDEPEAGLRVAEAAAKRRPGLPVLYTTGRGITHGMIKLFVEPYGFLSKPYTGDQLVTAASELLRRVSNNRPRSA